LQTLLEATPEGRAEGEALYWGSAARAAAAKGQSLARH
jgi:hypothetical protein